MQGRLLAVKKSLSIGLISLMSVFSLVQPVAFAETKSSPSKETPFPSQSSPARLSTLALPDGQVGNEHIEALVAQSGRFNMGIKELGTSNNWYNIIYNWPSSPSTSFTTVKVDGADRVFGNYYNDEGSFITEPHNVDDTTNEAVWKTGDVSVKQSLQTAINPATGIPDAFKIRYTITNTGTQSHDVGLRMMLDTMVNGNDHAPFRVPTSNGIESVTKEKDYLGGQVPAFWQAFQTFDNPDLSSQYTMSGIGATAPDRFTIANWSSIQNTLWDYSITSNRETGDSAVGMWWNPATIAPGETKTITTFYGRPGVGGDQTLVLSGRKRLSYPEWSTSPISLIAYLNNNLGSNLTNVTIKLEPDSGLSLVDGDAVHSLGNLPAGTNTQTTWRVKPTSEGVHELTVNAYHDGATAPFASAVYQIEALAPVVPPNISLGGDRGNQNDGTPVAGRTTPLTVNASFNNPTAVGVTLIATDATGDRYQAEMTTQNGVDWTITFTPAQVGLWETPLTIQIIPRYANGVTGTPLNFDVVLIDPSGIVYNAAKGDQTVWPLPGATVVLQYNDPELGAWVNMSEEAYPGRLAPITNPQVTGQDGRYAWDVAAGEYRVVVSRPGFQTVTSREVAVPPPVTDLHVGLTPTDSVSPSLSVTGVTYGGTYSQPVTLNFAASDDEAGVRSVTYQLDGGSVQRPSGANGSLTVNTSGTHNVDFTVVDHAGNELTKKVTFKINDEPQTGQLAINKITVTHATYGAELTTPQNVGTPLRWTADVSGSGLKYEWTVYKDGAILKNQAFSQQNTVDWIPTEPGVYRTMAAVRDNQGHFAHQYSSNFYVISEPQVQQLKINSITVSSATYGANLTSPQPAGTPLHWTADVEGNGLKYEWTVYKDGAIVKKLAFSQQNTVDIASAEPGVYRVMVAVRDIYGAFDHKYSSNFYVISEPQVQQLKINSITVSSATYGTNPTSPQPAGTPLRWTAEVEGNGLKYEWTVYKDGAIVKKLDFSQQNTVDITSAEPGVYRVMVAVRDIYGAFDHKYSTYFTILRP